MSEHALLIPRVSSTKQREEDQTPGLLAYAERKGYTVDAVVPVHGRSAFHGRHVKAILAAIDKHVRHGNATVVIFRHVDRSSREGVFKGFDLLSRIMEAGARVEFSEQEYLGDQPGMIGMFFDMAKKESQIKQDRSFQGNTRKRAQGELIGQVPWGYDPVLRNGVQVNIKPNALGREWIPRIFAEIVNGKSLSGIVEMLKGVPSPKKHDVWDHTTVGRIIKNTTYYGSMRGNPNMKFDPLVSVELHKKANVALTSRVRRGRGTVKNEPALVNPICGACYGQERDGCPSGVSPMYRTNTNHKNPYYHCKGHGAARKGCGAPLIRIDELEATLDEAMSIDQRPHLVPEYVAGDDNDEQRSLINEKIRVAQEASDYLLVAQLAQEAMQLGPTVRKASIEMVDSGLTIGQRWQGLTREQKRDELLNYHVTAWKTPQGVAVLTWPRVP